MSEARELHGVHVRLRAAAEPDVWALVAIRQHPEVRRWWRGDDDLERAVRENLSDEDVTGFVIEIDGDVVGWIQFHEEDDPEYRHAGIDVYLDPARRGQGLGFDAIRTLATYLIDEIGHHRLVIDPAADNQAAIRCYAKVGFRPVGILRAYELGADGSFHDGLLMDLLAAELVRVPPATLQQPPSPGAARSG